MAIVFQSRRRSQDVSGNGYSGALLYVYDAGTLNLSSIYTDAGLSIAAANPVVADSNGVFPQWFAPEGSLYDLQTKTAGGVLLYAEVSVAAVGGQNASLVRDFTTSRFQARGSGGATYLEAGDPSPDNIGGIGRLGGWNGTQADSWTLDAALVNVTGRLKEQSYKIPGVVRSEAVAFTAVASVAVPLTEDPTGCREWLIEFIDINCSNSGVHLDLSFSFDAGATYPSTNFGSFHYAEGGTGGGASGSSSAAATSVALSGVAGLLTTLGRLADIRMSVVTTSTASIYTRAAGQGAGWGASTPAPVTGTFTILNSTSGRASHVKLSVSAGTMTGLYRVIPQRGLGET